VVFWCHISVSFSLSRIYWKNSAASANQKVEKWTLDYHSWQTSSGSRTTDWHRGCSSFVVLPVCICRSC